MNVYEIMLSVQRALIGNVTPNLRAVAFFLDQEIICLRLYYDLQPTELEEELASLTDTEFISDFPSPNYSTDFKIIVLPFPKLIPKEYYCVYKRYE